MQHLLTINKSAEIWWLIKIVLSDHIIYQTSPFFYIYQLSSGRIHDHVGPMQGGQRPMGQALCGRALNLVESPGLVPSYKRKKIYQYHHHHHVKMIFKSSFLAHILLTKFQSLMSFQIHLQSFSTSLSLSLSLCINTLNKAFEALQYLGLNGFSSTSKPFTPFSGSST